MAIKSPVFAALLFLSFNINSQNGVLDNYIFKTNIDYLDPKTLADSIALSICLKFNHTNYCIYADTLLCQWVSKNESVNEGDETYIIAFQDSLDVFVVSIFPSDKDMVRVYYIDKNNNIVFLIETSQLRPYFELFNNFKINYFESRKDSIYISTKTHEFRHKQFRLLNSTEMVEIRNLLKVKFARKFSGESYSDYFTKRLRH